MFVKRTLLLALALGCLSVTSNALAGQKTYLPETQWALENVPGFAGKSCRVSRQYNQDVQSIALHFYEKNWADLFVSFNGAGFEPGAVYETTLSGDGGYAQNLSARVLSAEKLVVQIKGTEDFLDTMQYSKGLNLVLGGNEYAFSNPKQSSFFEILSSCFGDQSFDEYAAKDNAPSEMSKNIRDTVTLVQLDTMKGIAEKGIAEKKGVESPSIPSLAPVTLRRISKPVEKPVSATRAALQRVLDKPLPRVRPSTLDYSAYVSKVEPAAGEGDPLPELPVVNIVKIREPESAVDAGPEISSGFQRLSRFKKKIEAQDNAKRDSAKQKAKSKTPTEKIVLKPIHRNVVSDIFQSPERPADFAAQAMEQQYARRASSGSVAVEREEPSASARVFKNVLDKIVGHKDKPAMDGPIQRASYADNALETVRVKPNIIDLSQSCNAAVPEEIEHLKPYISGNQTHAESDQELVESLKLKMQLLEREKEALRDNQPEEPGALSLVRVCTQEKTDMQSLAKRLEALEARNFEMSQIQNDIQAPAGESEEFDSMQSNIDELAAENRSLQRAMQEMRAYINELKLKEGADSSRDDPENPVEGADENIIDEITVEQAIEDVGSLSSDVPEPDVTNSEGVLPDNQLEAGQTPDEQQNKITDQVDQIEVSE